MIRRLIPKHLLLRNTRMCHVKVANTRVKLPPLSVPLNNVNHTKVNSNSSPKPHIAPFDAQVSKLDNGIRVVSEPHYGEYCTIGLLIESGSRYEAGYTLGTSHLVEKLAYGATSLHSTRDEIYSVLERNGGLIDCQSTRDTFVYAASCHISGMDSVLQILANAAWRPSVTEEEFAEAQLIVHYENEDMASKIECEPLMTDWIHQAAFHGNTLGFSKYTTDEAATVITRNDVIKYMSQYHAPDRIVLAGVGVSHDDLMTSAKKHFDFSTTTWAQEPNALKGKIPELDKSMAQYTAGEIRIERDLSKLAAGTPYPNLAHVALGFEGVGYKDDDYVTFCVLQSLLGGGGSFSAGGPGKGMYTRLYTDLMNRFHFVYGATAYNHSYADSGLFCVHGSSDPEQINDTLIAILDQFLKLLKGTDKEELNRARTQLKSQLMMNLEIRPVMFEDAGRQVLTHGYRKKPYEYMEKIDQVQDSDIIRVAERMLAGRPSLVGYGEIKKLSRYEDVADAVAQRKLAILLPQKTKGFFNR